MAVFVFHISGNKFRQAFELGSRPGVAATASIAKALAFIHQEELQGDEIAHGNLRSSNIMLGNNVEPLHK